MPKISVVIPCYNVAPYVAKCLDTLTNQTLNDIEIICIDDKSTDDTTKIIAEYAKRDKRIKLIKQRKNQGVSIARNTGLDAAKGEYIGFVDPDDYIDLNFYGKLYAAATESGADIVKGGLICVKTDGTEDKSELIKRVAKDKRSFNYQFSTAIYKREFLDKNNLRFVAGASIGEDVNFLIKATNLANKVDVVYGTYYWYIRRDDSAYSPTLNHNKIVSAVTVSQDLFDWLESQQGISKADYIMIMRTVFSLLTTNIPHAQSRKDQELLAAQILKTFAQAQYKKEILHDNFYWYAISAIKRQKLEEVVNSMLYIQKTYRLFGILPVFKTLHVTGYEYRIVLFKRINLIKIINRHRKDIVYLCGIPLLKIVH